MNRIIKETANVEQIPWYSIGEVKHKHKQLDYFVIFEREKEREKVKKSE